MIDSKYGAPPPKRDLFLRKKDKNDEHRNKGLNVIVSYQQCRVNITKLPEFGDLCGNMTEYGMAEGDQPLSQTK